MKKYLLLACYILFPLLIWAQVGSEESGTIEQNEVIAGPNGLVLTTVLLEDRKILIGGEFTSFNGTPAGRIARLNSDGSLDPTFSSISGANGSVLASLVQPDGKILIAGNFTSYGGMQKKHIARLNEDGSLDSTFHVGDGPNNSILSIAIDANGRILIGGTFDSLNGISKNYIARLNSEGSVDTTFDPGVGVNANVYSISKHQDGKILIGGDFTSYNNVSINRIIRLNQYGGHDTSFDVGDGANNTIRAIAVQNDGKILIGGDFLTYNGNQTPRIARLNIDGSLDTSFNTGSGLNNTVWDILIESEGKILVQGSFNLINGVEKKYLVKLNSDGSLDTSF